MHTERQLAIVALEKTLLEKYSSNATEGEEPERERPKIDDALGESLQVMKNEAKHLLEGAKIPLGSEQFFKFTEEEKADLKGTLCIYMEFPPCRNNADDDCKYPCVAYYQRLAEVFQKVNFRIYFHNFINIPTKTGAIEYIDLPLLFKKSVSIAEQGKTTLRVEQNTVYAGTQKILKSTAGTWSANDNAEQVNIRYYCVNNSNAT